MTQGSKSQKDNEKTEVSDEGEAREAETEAQAGDADSSGDTPVVIEGEAVETQPEDTPEQPDDTEGTAENSEETSSADVPPPSPPATVPQRESSGPGALALVFGGIIAGAIGYGASFLSPPPKPVIDPELSASIDAAGQRIDSLAADMTALQNAPAPEAAATDLSGVEAQLGDLSSRLDGIDSEISVLNNSLEQTSAALKAGTEDLSQRIAALESIEPSGMPAASEDQIAAFRDRLQAITSDAEARLKSATDRAAELESQAAARAKELEDAAAARAEKLQSDAKAAAAAAEQEAARVEAEARRQAALADLNAAMENGTPFAPALDTLGEQPEALAVVAEKGVPTLSELQQSFPAAARAALTQASTVPENASATDRLAAFLKRRTGARSLTPQEGDTPDAILSRAEAAVDKGDLPTALAEVETLPEPSQAAMGDWIDRARTRAAALQALDGLTATN